MNKIRFPGNKPNEEVFKINTKTFKYYLQKDGCTIRDLANITSRSERSIRRFLSEEKIPFLVLFDIADYMHWAKHIIGNIVTGCPFITKRKYAEWLSYIMECEANILSK